MTKSSEKEITYIILDRSIIVKYPKLLGLKIPNVRFIVVKTFISERVKDKRKGLFSINKRTNWELICLINSASDLGLINLENSEFEDLIDSNENSNLINGWEILSIIKKRKELEAQGYDVKVAVGEDRKYSVTSSDNIVFSETEIIDLIKKYEFTLDDNPDFKESILKYIFLPFYILAKNFFFGIIISTCLLVTINNFNYLTSTFDSRILAGIATSIGIFLYFFRENFRQIYGFVEVAVGIFTLYKTIDSNQPGSLNSNYFLGLLGGLYIIVRGVDNFVKSLKDTPWGIWLKENLGVGA